VRQLGQKPEQSQQPRGKWASSKAKDKATFIKKNDLNNILSFVDRA